MLTETRLQPIKALWLIDVVPAGMSTWPLASGVIQHPAVGSNTANTASRRKSVVAGEPSGERAAVIADETTRARERKSLAQAGLLGRQKELLDRLGVDC